MGEGETLGAHKAGIRMQTVGLIGISAGDTDGFPGPNVGTCVLTDSGGEAGDELGTEVGPRSEKGGSSRSTVGVFVLASIGVDGLGAPLGGGGRAIGTFVLPNVEEGEIVGAHKAGIRMQTDGLAALSSGGKEGVRGSGVGAFVLTDIGVGLCGEMGEGVDPGSLVGTFTVRNVGAGVRKDVLGETVGAHSAGIRMQTDGLT